jgi:hypothetical protein
LIGRVTGSVKYRVVGHTCRASPVQRRVENARGQVCSPPSSPAMASLSRSFNRQSWALGMVQRRKPDYAKRDGMKKRIVPPVAASQHNPPPTP